MRHVLLVIRDLLYAFSFEEFDQVDDTMQPLQNLQRLYPKLMWSTDDIQTLQAMIMVSALSAKLKQYALKVLTEEDIGTLELMHAPVPLAIKPPVLPHCPSMHADLGALDSHQEHCRRSAVLLRAGRTVLPATLCDTRQSNDRKVCNSSATRRDEGDSPDRKMAPPKICRRIGTPHSHSKHQNGERPERAVRGLKVHVWVRQGAAQEV